MKLRLFPILISLLISSVVLFGGWFLYDSVAMENPLSDIVNSTKGVEQSDVQIDNKRVTVDVKLTKEASLRDLYTTIREQGKAIIKDREIVIDVTNDSTPELETWWSKALFQVAEAMELKRYGEIPETLNRLANHEPGYTAVSEIDDTYVYVRITDGKSSKFVMLPRTPAKLGVWTNE
jgi:hypothetical protein